MKIPLGITVRPEVLQLRPYVPGKPSQEVRREFGLSEVIKLASNENPLGPSPKAVLAAQQACQSSHIYPASSSPELQFALGKHVGVPADWVFVSSGSDEIIRLLAATYIQPGDSVVVPACSFPNYRAASTLMGARVTAVPLADWTMDLPTMAAAVKAGQQARLSFLCRPNNPTGAVFSEEAFRAFMADVPTDTLVVVDEAYKEFDQSSFDSLGLLQAYPNLLLTRTFSKAYGLAGFRIGYGIGRPELWEPVYRVREPFSVNLIAQAAALAALSDPEHLARTQAAAREAHAYFEELCRDLGLSYVPSHGNFLLIDLGRPAQPVYEALLRQGVIVRPCGGFGLPNHIRVTFGVPHENEVFATSLRKALEEPV